MSSVERLAAQLRQSSMILGGITLGSKSVDDETVAAEILRSIEAMKKGDFDIVDSSEC